MTTNPHGGNNGNTCKPGCNCGRHKSVHRSDCKCNRCPGHPSARKRIYAPPRRPDRCACGHIEARHDAFGCKTCEDRGYSGKRLCAEFRQHGAPVKPRDNTFAREVQREGFITHNLELATCTNCWGVIKIGFVHSVSCVINAKAHSQKCRKPQGRRPPRSSLNRANGIG